MSEEILKALMQFFAILAKEDEETLVEKRTYVEQFLNNQLSQNMVAEYLEFYDKKSKVKKKSGEASKRKMTSVGDSVRILGICKKINKTLTQKQKIVVLVRLFEFLYQSKEFASGSMQIIETAAEVFNIDKDEYNDIHGFALYDLNNLKESDSYLVVNSALRETSNNQIIRESIDAPLLIVKVQSVNVYFIRYFGSTNIKLNNRVINPEKFNLFAPGSIITLIAGTPIYFSDVVSLYLSQEQELKLSFVADALEYKFPNGNIGVQSLTLEEEAGKLVGIMGGSGAGKSTLLNVLSGIEKPSAGSVRINGVNLHTDHKKIEGVIGFVPQDDLLIEELTVYQNLYYNAKLCFKNLSDKEVKKKVVSVIDSLGLTKTRDLKVGSPLEKIISGGQRKRLNIGLELIREPSVLFLDEPTSGLSSKDSVNVVELLRLLALKGKLVFVVIHQPSSEIYKMFDRMVIMDQGGYMAYYGNPIEAISHFKNADNQIDSDFGDCHSCGTVTSEVIFDILESKIVNDFGELTETRKIEPTEWNELYNTEVKKTKIAEETTAPEKALFLPSKISQWIIFLKRDVLSKIANKQYMLITFLEAPVLAFILAFVVRKSSEKGVYIFSENGNIPSYLFMAIIVCLFLGLTVSAEEIFRDRKILKRERFLNLSRNSYLLSKVFLLMVVSAIQSSLFVLIGNTVLEIQGMFWGYFSTLFAVSVLANIIGLNISSAFNSAVTIYIIIPLLIIPQMILGGAMFSFDKLNNMIGGGQGNNVPFIAEFIPARWAYEGLMVDQFMHNKYGENFFDIEQSLSVTSYKQAYLVPLLEDKVASLRFYLIAPSPSQKVVFEEDLILIKNIIKSENKKLKRTRFENFEILNPEKFDSEAASELEVYLIRLKSFYSRSFLLQATKREIRKGNTFDGLTYDELETQYSNDYVNKILTNAFNSSSYLVADNQLFQVKDPIYLEPDKNVVLGLGSHFFSPHKSISGNKLDTSTYNKLILVLMSIIGYVVLYLDGLKKAINIMGSLGPKSKIK